MQAMSMFGTDASSPYFARPVTMSWASATRIRLPINVNCAGSFSVTLDGAGRRAASARELAV